MLIAVIIYIIAITKKYTFANLENYSIKFNGINVIIDEYFDVVI